MQWIDNAAEGLAAIRANLRAAPERPVEVSAPPGALRLRVLASALQLPDPSDPALLDGYVTATIRVRVGDDVVATRVLERTALPSFGARGAVIDIGRELGETEVRPWESLCVEVLAGDWSTRQPPLDLDALRFEDALGGDPTGWLGDHAPARSQPWRLWYRIEERR